MAAPRCSDKATSRLCRESETLRVREAAGVGVSPLAERFAKQRLEEPLAYFRETSSAVMGVTPVRSTGVGHGSSHLFLAAHPGLQAVDPSSSRKSPQGRVASMPTLCAGLPSTVVLGPAAPGGQLLRGSSLVLPPVTWSPASPRTRAADFPGKMHSAPSTPSRSSTFESTFGGPHLRPEKKSAEPTESFPLPVAKSVEALPRAAELESRPATPLLTRTASLPLPSSDKTRKRLIPGFTAPMQCGSTLWCTYCGDRLRTHKHLIQVWPEFIMCTLCAASPSCSTCHRKAFDAVVELKTSKKSFLCPKRADEGGLNLCGHCAVLSPVRSRKRLAQTTATAVAWLQSHGLHFTDDLLKYQRTEDVEQLLQRLDTDELLYGHLQSPAGSARKSRSADRNRVFIRSHESIPDTLCIEQGRQSAESLAGDQAETMPLERQRSLTIPVESVTFASLNPTPGTNIYGRCETEKTTVKSPVNGRCSSVPARLVRRVGVVRGLPQTFFLSHLTHELLHAYLWCRQPGEGSLRLDVEEGMCNWVSAEIFKDRLAAIDAREADMLAGEVAPASDAPTPLDSPVFAEVDRASPAALEIERLFLQFERRVINSRLRDMETDAHACYGDGYRAMREVIAAIGLPKTVELTRLYGDNLGNFVEAARKAKEAERTRRRAVAREAV
ncbi:hypothetical protein TGRUB_233180 [Toxoplasma gondii RUB]|uniref:Protein DA1-like domain-containing protein n=3 Tax=Toxoplasma gondii TaxID=5811 RepID=A0A086M4P2_TOXGO|nr:hypothetical protein TGRUB_233180 [Toxoplasma gondii RUB]KFH11375.1 hypothetical protein TGVAND_233180 [Toxoplasma gondii VAND]RQX75679.1 hypothetical protein TGCAST_233180 [Toxoplasma gondii CAST]